MSSHSADPPSMRHHPVVSAAQRHLLAAAADAFAERGYGGTTTRDIAARAKRSPAAVYIHYPSKEDLLFAVSFMGHDSALNCLANAAGAAEPSNRVQQMVYAFSQWHMDNAKLARVSQYEFVAMTAAHRGEIARLRRSMQHMMRDAIQMGVDCGDFDVADISAAADAALSLSIDLVRWFDPSRMQHRDSIARQHADLVLRMLHRCT